MTDINSVTVIGRITKDAEMKRIETDMPLGFFTIATNRSKKDSGGNFTNEASFFDVNIYGRYAETIIGRLKKGVQVCITGSLKQERWSDYSGQNRSRVMIIAESVQFLGAKKDE